MTASDLHLIGLVSIFIASKYTASTHILIEDLLEEAGHGLFTKDAILMTERDILKALNFKVGISAEDSLFESSSYLLKQCIYSVINKE